MWFNSQHLSQAAIISYNLYNSAQVSRKRSHEFYVGYTSRGLV